MAGFTVTIKGIDGDLLKMDRAVHRTAEEVLERGIYRMQADLQVYPPAPASSTYQRTGTLGRRWTVRANSGSLQYQTGNDTGYGPLVQDEERQAKVHARTGWPTVQKVAERRGQEIATDMATSLSRTLGGG